MKGIEIQTQDRGIFIKIINTLTGSGEHIYFIICAEKDIITNTLSKVGKYEHGHKINLLSKYSPRALMEVCASKKELSTGLDDFWYWKEYGINMTDEILITGTEINLDSHKSLESVSRNILSIPNSWLISHDSDSSYATVYTNYDSSLTELKKLLDGNKELP